MNNTILTVNGKTYEMQGTVTIPPMVRAETGDVIWISLNGPRGAYYTLACNERGMTALYRGIFNQLVARDVEVA